MSVAEAKKLKLDSVGPIEGEFSIALDGPGLYELRGSKGKGKSTVLNALSLIAGHKVSLTVHDGELAGSVEGFGVVVPVGSRKKRRGECEVDTFDTEKFDLIDLIDPDGKTAETRDAVRIKALASLCGLQLTPADFFDLAGGQQAYESLGIVETSDPVLFTNRVKAAFDSEAKQKEKYGATEEGHAKSLMEQVASIDISGESDAEVLAVAVEEASTKLARLLEQEDAAAKAQLEREAASAAIDEARAAYKGWSVAEATAMRDECQGAADLWTNTVADLEKELQVAKSELLNANGAYETATAHLERAVQHERDIQSWQETLTGKIDAPTEEEIDAAREDKEAAKRAQEQGVRIRDAKQALAKAEVHKQSYIEAAEAAEQLRAAASDVFAVLRERLHTSVIRIESVAGAPRLVVNHSARGKTFFDQDDGLSDGERVKTSIDELLPHLKSPGLFPVPQRTYQDLPPSDRKELAAYAREKGLYMFGAQVTDGDLEVVKV